MAAALVFRLPDGGPELVRDVLLERGWEDFETRRRHREDWNLYWKNAGFCSSDYKNLMPWQRLNHHPKTAGLTRKDCLARHLKRMRATFGACVYNFSPTTFILPNNYIRFLSEYNRLRVSAGVSVYWICKPVDLSRGRGIFIFHDLKNLVYDCTVIVQRYIADPLLVSGYKFDLRIYVCVKSFHPLTIYIHQEGLVRFATEKYRLSSLGNLYAHLTNTSINKSGPFYKADKESVGQGCKWTMSKFRHFLYGQDVNQLLFWQKINNIVTLTLLAIAPSAPPSPNCLELLGFDVLVDGRFKPWLLEVNYSPALTLDCQADLAVKKDLVGDLIDLMNYTLVDGLRGQVYRRKGRETPSSDSPPKPWRVSDSRTQIPKLPSLKSQAEKGQRKSTLLGSVSGPLPPVDPNKTSVIMATNSQTLDLICSRHSRTKPSNRHVCPLLTDHRSRHGYELTHRHDDETQSSESEHLAEGDASSQKRDIPRRGSASESSAVPWKLPRIHRVGDFIRTFPFNAATLRASQPHLDVKTVVQEVKALTAQLSGRRRIKKKKTHDDDTDLESLLWGPKDPPLITTLI